MPKVMSLMRLKFTQCLLLFALFLGLQSYAIGVDGVCHTALQVARLDAMKSDLTKIEPSSREEALEFIEQADKQFKQTVASMSDEALQNALQKVFDRYIGERGHLPSLDKSYASIKTVQQVMDNFRDAKKHNRDITTTIWNAIYAVPAMTARAGARQIRIRSSDFMKPYRAWAKDTLDVHLLEELRDRMIKTPNVP
jgi:hypothetical protein